MDTITLEIPNRDIAFDTIRNAIDHELSRLSLKIKFIWERLKEYETEHHMATERFIRKFETGQLGDDEIWFQWAADVDRIKRLEQKCDVLNEVGNGDFIRGMIQR